MSSLLAASNNKSFFLLILVVSLGLTSTNRQIQFLGKNVTAYYPMNGLDLRCSILFHHKYKLSFI